MLDAILWSSPLPLLFLTPALQLLGLLHLGLFAPSLGMACFTDVDGIWWQWWTDDPPAGHQSSPSACQAECFRAESCERFVWQEPKKIGGGSDKDSVASMPQDLNGRLAHAPNCWFMLKGAMPLHLRVSQVASRTVMGPKVCSDVQEDASQEAHLEKPQAAFDVSVPKLNVTSSVAVNETMDNPGNATTTTGMGESFGTGWWVAALMALTLVGLCVRLYFIFRSGVRMKSLLGQKGPSFSPRLLRVKK